MRHRGITRGQANEGTRDFNSPNLDAPRRTDPWIASGLAWQRLMGVRLMGSMEEEKVSVRNLQHTASWINYTQEITYQGVYVQ